MYPKHQLIESVKQEYPMKYGVKIILRTLDLSKAKSSDFEEECNNLASELSSIAEQCV